MDVPERLWRLAHVGWRVYSRRRKDGSYRFSVYRMERPGLSWWQKLWYRGEAYHADTLEEAVNQAYDAEEIESD